MAAWIRRNALRSARTRSSQDFIRRRRPGTSRVTTAYGSITQSHAFQNPRESPDSTAPADTTGLGFLEQSKPHPHSRSRTWKSLSMTTASAPKMVPSPTAMERPATTLTIGRPTNVAAHENRSPSSDASHLQCKDPAARVLLRRADLTSEFSISHTR